MPVLDQWSNANYIVLAEAIARETKIHISKNTLKRVFGKLKTEEFYHPQKATLNALALFVGYRNWDELVSKEIVPVDFELLAEETATARFTPQWKTITILVTRPFVFVVLAFIFLAAAIILSQL